MHHRNVWTIRLAQSVVKIQATLNCTKLTRTVLLDGNTACLYKHIAAYIQGTDPQTEKATQFMHPHALVYSPVPVMPCVPHCTHTTTHSSLDWVTMQKSECFLFWMCCSIAARQLPWLFCNEPKFLWAWLMRSDIFGSMKTHRTWEAFILAYCLIIAVTIKSIIYMTGQRQVCVLLLNTSPVDLHLAWRRPEYLFSFEVTLASAAQCVPRKRT